jgi:hypothetical protein
MEIILLLVSSISNIVCLVVGAKVGQTVSKGEPIEMPSVNPIEAIREHNDKKEADREQDRLETILRNIERYDGSANGQEEVPRG